ncbi:unnamed protein product [Ambrosiozyma monospora]|uniref:Unnamed protein product n=1 Tax=Ambrosiozyma monospora TaxID=43982 RepID=A0ACB5SSC1_AMBMO|nr:unnamed protein product [Ambrosiozyma monospora]
MSSTIRFFDLSTQKRPIFSNFVKRPLLDLPLEIRKLFIANMLFQLEDYDYIQRFQTQKHHFLKLLSHCFLTLISKSANHIGLMTLLFIITLVSNFQDCVAFTYGQRMIRINPSNKYQCSN